jgi:hypothetical protein
MDTIEATVALMGINSPSLSLTSGDGSTQITSPITAIEACCSKNSDSEDPEEERCYICTAAHGLLTIPCNCPPQWKSHPRCIAEWQLRNSGTARETHCSFCNSVLPDWRLALTPHDLLARLSSNEPVPATMNVAFHGESHSFKVVKGLAGYQRFTQEIRSKFALPNQSELNISFTCDNPSNPDSTIVLQGLGAYDSAVHLAAISMHRKSLCLEGPSQAVSLDAFGSRWWVTEEGPREVRGRDAAMILRETQGQSLSGRMWRLLYHRLRAIMAADSEDE